MQLSPKSIFIGLVALGLPIAVAVGWNLAGPGKQPITATQDGGTGGIGAAAPAEGAGDGEPYSVRYSARPYSSPATVPSSSAAPVASSAGPVVVPSAPPSVSPPAPVVSSSAPPVLNEPPVPTPTEITEVPIPSGSTSADPSIDPVVNP